MTAEEYIKNLSTTFKNPDIDSTSKIVETFIAKKAIEMARQEEREKAIELHMKYCGNYRCPSNKQSFGNNQCSGNCLIMESFKNDLEK